VVLPADSDGDTSFVAMLGQTWHEFSAGSAGTRFKV
jgi:hypothetical protein